jgi:uncharacterized membrane protein YfcA
LGLLGSGGAIFTTPIFVYIWHFPDKQALASSFVIVMIVGMLSIWRHLKEGNVNIKVICLFAPMTMFGAHLGSKIAATLSGATQLAMLSLLMIFAAGVMLRDILKPREPCPSLDPSSDPFLLNGLIFTGFLVGILVGCVGIGGGFIIVPLLVALAGIPLPQAIGTALCVAILNSMVGSYEHMKYVEIQWGPVLSFASVAALGGIVGTRMISLVPAKALKTAFVVLLIFAAGFLFYDNRAGLNQVLLLRHLFS